MTRPAFRPRLAALEDRLTPAAPPEVVWNALVQVKADTTAMHYAADHAVLALSPNHQADTRTLMTAVRDHFDMVVPIFNDFLTDLGTQAGADPRLIGAFAPFVQAAASAIQQAQVNATYAQFTLNMLPPASSTTTGATTSGTGIDTTGLGTTTPGAPFPTTSSSTGSTAGQSTPTTVATAGGTGSLATGAGRATSAGAGDTGTGTTDGTNVGAV